MSHKSEVLQRYLTEKGVDYHPARMGWQKVSCFSDEGHPHGDRNPSASVNLVTGHYHCFGCELAGDVYDLVMVLESLSYPEAKQRFGGDEGKAPPPEPTWI